MGLPNIGPLELIIILAIALLIVGPRRLPEMGNAVGRTIREFRKASSDIGDATSVKAEPAKAEPAVPAPAVPAPAVPAPQVEPEPAVPVSSTSAAAVPGLTADATEDAAPRA
jgi:sec-independent protein translocase protein TatA